MSYQQEKEKKKVQPMILDVVSGQWDPILII